MSLNNNSNLSLIDFYNREPLAECSTLQILGGYCILLFISSLMLNGALMFLLIRQKEYKNSLNMYMCALIGLNLFGTITELPWIIISNFYCK